MNCLDASPTLSIRARHSRSGAWRVECKTIQVEDTLSDPEYMFPRSTKAWRLSLRIPAVPLLRDGKAIAGIAPRTQRSASFLGAAIELVETFADQAVIAIENVRLFEEVKARTADCRSARVPDRDQRGPPRHQPAPSDSCRARYSGEVGSAAMRGGLSAGCSARRGRTTSGRRCSTDEQHEKMQCLEHIRFCRAGHPWWRRALGWPVRSGRRT